MSYSHQMALSKAYWGEFGGLYIQNIVSGNFNSSSRAALQLRSVLAAILTELEQLSAKAPSAGIEKRSEEWLLNPIQRINVKLEIIIQNTKIIAIPFLLTEQASPLLLFLPVLLHNHPPFQYQMPSECPVGTYFQIQFSRF